MAEQLAEALAAAIGGGFSKVALYPMDMCAEPALSALSPYAPEDVWALKMLAGSCVTSPGAPVCPPLRVAGS